MPDRPTRRAVVVGSVAVGALAGPVCAAMDTPSPALQAALDYAQGQKTTGFLIVRGGKTVVERNWPAPADAAMFHAMTYERNADGELLEDVASQQKSFVAMLVAIAVDKGLIDVTRPVDAYLGAGWSKATPVQEAAICVIDVLTMSTGLTEGFAFEAAPGTRFFYNTPVYAVTKRILAAAAGQPLDRITHDWLTAPVGMADTAWRQRPASMAGVGNPTGLVTSPRDVARFGQVVLDGGKAADGRRVVSAPQLHAMFERSATNPAYGRLWWLNGGAYAIKAGDKRADGPLIPAAPADLVAALGALDRRLYVVPSEQLVVVRMGAAAPDPAFDQALWERLAKAL